MTETSTSARRAGDQDGTGGQSTERDFSMERLRPIMEGARARGLADGLELLGAGAVLLDDTGAVLHLTSGAKRSLGGVLRLVGEHLIAADAPSNQIMERLIALVLSGTPCEDLLVSEDENAPALRVRAAPLPGARGDAAQLLKAVLFLSLAASSAQQPPHERARAA